MDATALAALLGATPVSSLELDLPKAGSLAISVLRRIETRAPEDVPRARCCWAPNKPALLFEGRATWAEFILVDLLDAADWEARWVRNWAGGRQFCTGVGELKRLNGRGAELFEAIHTRAPELRGAGTWDVIAWSGDEVLFLESKQAHSSDRLRVNQLTFLDTALDLGMHLDSFAVVEYDAGARPVASRSPEDGEPSLPRQEPAPRARRRTVEPELDSELVRLIEAAAAARASGQIEHRDRIAAHGSAAIPAMVAWANDGRSPGFAVAVLESVGRLADPHGATRAMRRLRVSLVGWETVIDPAIARVEAARRSVARPPSQSGGRASGTEVYVASGTPPPSQGACGIQNRDGSECHNPGRRALNGVWSCTTHFKAASRRGEAS